MALCTAQPGRCGRAPTCRRRRPSHHPLAACWSNCPTPRRAAEDRRRVLPRPRPPRAHYCSASRGLGVPFEVRACTCTCPPVRPFLAPVDLHSVARRACPPTQIAIDTSGQPGPPRIPRHDIVPTRPGRAISLPPHPARSSSSRTGRVSTDRPPGCSLPANARPGSLARACQTRRRGGSLSAGI